MRDYFDWAADRAFNSAPRSRPVNSVEYEHVDISEMQGIVVREPTSEERAMMLAALGEIV